MENAPPTRDMVLLPCYRFRPTPEEIIRHYLFKKVKGLRLDPRIPITEFDVYDEEERWRSFFERDDDDGEKIHYFFTKLTKKSENGSRINRGTNYGSWKGQKDTMIYFENKVIGTDGLFSYKPKPGFQGNGQWVMHEYRIDGYLLRMVQENDYVVCRVVKKEEKKRLPAIHKPILGDLNHAKPATTLMEVQNNIQLREPSNDERVTDMDGVTESRDYINSEPVNMKAIGMTTQVEFQVVDQINDNNITSGFHTETETPLQKSMGGELNEDAASYSNLGPITEEWQTWLSIQNAYLIPETQIDPTPGAVEFLESNQKHVEAVVSSSVDLSAASTFSSPLESRRGFALQEQSNLKQMEAVGSSTVYPSEFCPSFGGNSNHASTFSSPYESRGFSVHGQFGTRSAEYDRPIKDQILSPESTSHQHQLDTQWPRSH